MQACDLSAAHGMSRVHSIARQDRDVVMLGRIQNDLAGIHVVSCVDPGRQTPLPISHTAAAPRTVWPLSQEIVARAALRHDWHVAGVEVRPKDGRGSLRSDCRAARRQGVRLAIGVDEEGAVFLNNPAVVLSDSDRLVMPSTSVTLQDCWPPGTSSVTVAAAAPSCPVSSAP